MSGEPSVLKWYNQRPVVLAVEKATEIKNHA